jgi:hypothetical protein
MTDRSELDRSVRLYVYGQFLEGGGPPTAEETAAALHTTAAEVRAAFERLEGDRVLVLSPFDRSRVQMAMPFSAVPTAFSVSAVGRVWWANCAWDALGIPAMLNADAAVESACAQSSAPITLTVENGRVGGDAAVVHLAVPAARWWDDIFFT